MLTFDLATGPRIRCHFLARNLVYWARTKQKAEFQGAATNPWRPNFCAGYDLVAWNKLHIVDRQILKLVCLRLMELAAPDDVVRLHFTPVFFVLESLPADEQRQILEILQEWYGPASA